MLKPLNITAEQVLQQPRVDESLASKVFKVLHGSYGTLFLSKFSTGIIDSAGSDKGTLSARRVWAVALRKYPPDVVGTALDRCHKAHPEFPPGLPQFVALCEAAMPAEVFGAPVDALEISPELQARHAAEARSNRQKHLEAARALLDGPVVTATGLDALKQCIANAVGIAGGDEAAELLRLDRQLAPRAGVA